MKNHLTQPYAAPVLAAALSVSLSSAHAQAPLSNASVPRTVIQVQQPVLADGGSRVEAPNTVYLQWTRPGEPTTQNLSARDAQLRAAEQNLASARRVLEELQRITNLKSASPHDRAALHAAITSSRELVANSQAALLRSQGNRNPLGVFLLPNQQLPQPSVSTEVKPAQPELRYLLFTPADARQVRLFHPLLTPETTAPIIHISLTPQQPQDSGHK